MCTTRQGGGWQLWVLDLATLSARALVSETRSIDDQVEWLDDGHILHQFPSDDGNNVWVAGVDDATPPGASSPTRGHRRSRAEIAV